MRPLPNDILSSEEWLPVVGYELLYLISRWGQVFSLISNKMLKPVTTGRYLQVLLYKDGVPCRKLVHHIVMEAFVGPCPEGMEVNHKDGDKTNNCLSNLEYVTCSENHKHAYSIGQKNQKGSLNNTSRANEEKVIDIRKRAENGETQQSIADDYGMAQATIGAIVRRETWAHVV